MDQSRWHQSFWDFCCICPSIWKGDANGSELGDLRSSSWKYTVLKIWGDWISLLWSILESNFPFCRQDKLQMAPQSTISSAIWWRIYRRFISNAVENQGKLSSQKAKQCGGALSNSNIGLWIVHMHIWQWLYHVHSVWMNSNELELSITSQVTHNSWSANVGNRQIGLKRG